MASYLRPCVALGSWSPKNNGPLGPNSYRHYRNAEFFTESRTPWVRFWVSWNHLQPFDARDPATDTRAIPGFPGMTPQYIIWSLDDEIRQARAAGRKVVLTFWECPAWARRNNQQRGPQPPTYPSEWCPPDDVGDGSPWSIMLWYLAARYNINKPPDYDPRLQGVYVDFLEVCNEPNLQWWPQVDWDGSRQLYRWAARMMKTARAVSQSLGNQPIVLGPALSDTQSTNSNRTDWRVFMDKMFDHFSAMGFVADQHIGWSAHNYKDVEDGTYGATHRVSAMRDKLIARGWRGWPYANPSSPYLLCTEGGARLNLDPPNTTEWWQRDRIDWAWRRINIDTGDGAGVAMFTNYLFWSVDYYDCGFCKALTESPPPRESELPYPAARPAFWRWRDLPTTASR